MELLYPIDENVKWYTIEENSMGGGGRKNPQKLKIKLPFDTAISVLSIYQKELKAGSQKNTCKTISITALFTIA